MQTIWIGIGIFILVAEALLWMIFKHKLHGLHFPRSVDESFFRFFSLARLRLVVILHTLLLAGTFILITVYLW